LGYYEGDAKYGSPKLIFAGKSGTGFAGKTGRELIARLRQLERPDPPFTAVPRAYQRGAR
jgi:hypothetical protein